MTQAPTQYWQSRLPFFYGWVIVVIAFLMSFMTAGVFWATGVLAVPMHEDLGWSLSSIYLGLTMRVLVGGGAMALLGRYADLKHGARVLAVVSGAVAAASLLAVAYVDHYWQYLLAYGFIGGLTTGGTGFLILSAVVPRWFLRRRGRALAFATMGSGAAAFVLPPVLALVLEAFDWRGSWAFVAALTAVGIVLPSALIWRQPEDIGLVPDGGDAPVPAGRAASVAQPVRDATLREAVRSPLLWLLIFAVTLAMLSPNGVPATLVPMYIEKGHTTQTAAWGFSIYGIFSVLARFFWGFLAERYSIRTVTIAIAVFSCVSMPMLNFLDGDVALVYSALVGFGIGGFIGTHVLILPAYFGRRHLGAISGVSRPFDTTMNAVGPLLMAQSFDRTGGYGFGLWFMGLSWALCAAAMLLARATPSRSTHAAPAQQAAPAQPSTPTQQG